MYAKTAVNHNSSNMIQNPNIVHEVPQYNRNDYNLEVGKASTKMLSLGQDQSKSSTLMKN